MRTSCEKKQAGRSISAARITLALLTFVLSAQASTNYVTNGSFTSTTNGAGLQFNSDQTGGDYTTADGWTSSNSGGDAYNFIFAPGTADTTGATGQYGGLTLWGTNDGGLDAIPASSPDGGNFIAADADFQNGAISQIITGLTVGAEYQVGFWWAASQQAGFDGDTQQHWQVSLGSEVANAPTYDLPSHGFSGWMYQTIDFSADATTDVLSFLAVGNVPVPPFLLLDGVSMNSAVPEPGSATLLLAGALIGLAAIARKRYRQMAVNRTVGPFLPESR